MQKPTETGIKFVRMDFSSEMVTSHQYDSGNC